MPIQKQRRLPAKSQLIGLVLLLLAAAVLYPQIGHFRESLLQLHHLRYGWLAAGISLTLLTYLAAGATYYFLAFRPLKYRKTVIAQFAAMFTNRLLPSGIGAVGTNYAYLRAHKQTNTQAGTMVAVNNLFGLLGHGLILGSVLIFSGAQAHLAGPRVNNYVFLAGFGGAVLVLTVIRFSSRLRTRVVHAIKNVATQIRSYSKQPARTLAALASSSLLTLCNMLSLYACLLAVGGHASFVVVCLVFTFGIGASTAIPTPGGLGGFEAGLLAGFIGYAIPHSTALSAVIVYRLISYWLTLLIGAGAFAYASRQGYFRLRKK